MAAGTYVLERDPQGLEFDLGNGAADAARIVAAVTPMMTAGNCGVKAGD